MDYKGRTAPNVSFSTMGLDTARVWLERGYLSSQADRGHCNVRMSLRYDHTDSLQFLKHKVKHPLLKETRGLTSWEYAIGRGSWNCLMILFEEALANNYFSDSTQSSKFISILTRGGILIDYDCSIWRVRVLCKVNDKTATI